MNIPAARIWFPADERRRILAEIDAALQSGQLTLGAHGRAFEEEFARVAGTRHAVAVSSGTAALEIILRALGLAGAEVLVPTNTFFATAAAVVHAGATPVFCDVEPETFMATPATLAAAAGPDTRAVVMVHVGGAVSPHWDEIAAWCAQRDLLLVEDAAHAHGSAFRGRPAGSLARAAAFSFYPTKVMTSAEGGMITTDDEALAEQARIYRDQGKAGFTANIHTHMGANWRLSEVHAIIGRSQLRLLGDFVAHRRRLALLYDEGIPGLEVVRYPATVASNYYKYCALLPRDTDRAALKKRLRGDHGVALSGEVYERPLHEQDVFRPYARGPLPVAEEVCARQVCLPISAVMTDDEARYVMRTIAEVLAG